MKPVRALRQSLRRLRTSPEKELTRWQRAGLFWIDLALHCARQLRADRVAQMAAALSYRTLFSLIPTFVLALVILRMFYGDDALARPLQQLLEFAGLTELEILGVDEAETGEMSAADWVQSIVQRVSGLNFAAIGVVGVGVLIYAALSLLFEIERAFNTIYRSGSRRGIVARVSRSWTVLTLAPIGLVVSFYLGEQFRTLVADLGGLRVVASAGLLVTFTISWLILLLAYAVVPNARVRLHPALIGSFVAALLWELGKFGFREYLGFATGYAAIYGSLGLVPVFLLWVYITWIVILFGLQISHVLQTLEAGRKTLKRLRKGLGGPPIDPMLRLAALAQIGSAFARGEAVTQETLLGALDVPEASVTESVEQLLRAGFIARVLDDQGEEAGYALSRPPESIALAEALALSASPREYHDALRPVTEAQADALKGRTLADLITGAPEE